jgi:hypothetical protein
MSELKQKAFDFTERYELREVIANPILLEEYFDLCNDIFGEIPDCSSCGKAQVFWDDMRMWSRDRKQIRVYEFATFKLKDIQIYSRGLKMMIARGNCTDEVAIRFIQSSADNVKYFESLPENWEALVYGNQEPIKEEITEVVTQVKADKPLQHNYKKRNMR